MRALPPAALLFALACRGSNPAYKIADEPSFLALVDAAAAPSRAADADRTPPDTAGFFSLDARANPVIPAALTGLVAWWKLDEGTGGMAADGVAPFSNGTLKNGPLWTTGGHPAARAPNPFSVGFDGKDDIIEIAWQEALDQASPKSVSLWFWYGTTPPDASAQNLIALVNPDRRSGIHLGFFGGNLHVWNWGGTEISGVPSPAVGWHHVAVVQQSDSLTLYLDAKTIGSKTRVFPKDPYTSVSLGAYVHPTMGTQEPFKGRIDDVRIYARPLNLAEVRTIFDGN